MPAPSLSDADRANVGSDVWFDAHLDLAYLAACGRDMNSPPERAGGPDLPAAVTLPSLHSGGVRAAFATIFIESGGTDPRASYAPDDINTAVARAREQMETYLAWARRGWVELVGRSEHASARTSERGREPGIRDSAFGIRAEQDSSTNDESRITNADPLSLGILIEGADALASPDDLEWWLDRGVVGLGLAWAKGTRYAAGNGVDPKQDHGLTDLGRALVERWGKATSDRRQATSQTSRDAASASSLSPVACHLSPFLDASHLSNRALDELFDLSPGMIVATHSNPRAVIASRPPHASAIPGALKDNPRAWDIVLQRHIPDHAIREIARRGGVVGLNLYSPFLIPGGSRERRATLAECVACVDHVCQLLGHHRAVGLGSDMDGGFSAERLPVGIDTPSDLPRLAEALHEAKFSDDAIRAFMWGNWARVVGA